ncbi:ABC transporter ATP-binding protein [Candidatus Parcubacteria bacterium]|nr:ABC transporter ATP-binding protein [Candidatus Parcubacteria bacterium]MBT3949311.1 ABC transporter ATP-binding protein [Candidatus Parcubacteria bacterium]
MIFLEVGIFYVAISLWKDGILTIGDFVLIQAYLLRVFMKLWDVGRIIRRFYEHLADAEEMTEILDEPHGITDTKTAKPLEVTKGEITFKDVNFAYNQTRRVIHKLNTTIKAHQKIALVGPSGAGKTTVVKLLLRQNDVTSGKIMIDGQRISAVTLESLWKNISLVPQDPILFHRTLIENIRYGKPDATDEEVIEAAKKAHCHEFISDFPDQYETYVGERGVKLSGGERQRVAIARAILRNAPILILDEATSSLDSQSELFIQDALDTLMKGKTVIVIAHRLSTIMRMDRIIVIDEGKVIEDGKHEELISKKDGIYKKLWKLQAGGFLD